MNELYLQVIQVLLCRRIYSNLMVDVQVALDYDTGLHLFSYELSLNLSEQQSC